MTEISISELEAVSGVEKQPEETTTEYLERLSIEADIDAQTTTVVKSALTRIIFSPETDIDKDESEALDKFLNAIEDIEQSAESIQNPEGAAEVRKSQEGEIKTTSIEYASQSSRESVSSTDTSSTPTTDTTTFQRRSQTRTFSHSRSLPVVGRISEIADQRFPSRESLEGIDYWCLAGIAIVGVYVFLQSIGSYPLRTWDESIYANTARHMVQNGEWLVPHLYVHPNNYAMEFQPFLEKPPLVPWLQGISMSILGVSRGAARVPTALFAIFSGMLVYRFGSKFYNRPAGFAAAVVLFTTPMIYSGGHGGRTANTDVPLLFFGTLFVYLSWIALTKDRADLLPFVGVAAGLALLTKGFSAGVFVIALAPIAILHFRTLLTRKTATMVGMTAAIALPWPLYAWSQYGHEFIEQIFLQQVLGRATGTAFGSQSGTLFPWMRYQYFQTFPEHFGIWVFLLFPAILIAINRGWQHQELKKPLFLVWWAASTFGFFVLTGNHGWYIMPMFVPCALLIGESVSALADQYRPAIAGLGVGAVAMVGIGGVSLGNIAVLLGTVVVTGIIDIREIAKSKLSRDDYNIASHVGPVLAALLVIAALVGGVPISNGDRYYKAEEQLGMTVAEEMPEGEALAVGPATGNYFVFSFYAQRPLYRAGLNQLNTDSEIRYAVVSDVNAPKITRKHSVIGEWRKIQVIRFADET